MLLILILVTAQANIPDILRGVRQSVDANRQGAAAPVNPQIPQDSANPVPSAVATSSVQVPTSTKNSTETQATPSTIPAIADPVTPHINTNNSPINLPLVLGVTISAAGALFITIYLILRKRNSSTGTHANKRESADSMEGLTSAQLQSLESEMNYTEINNAFKKKEILV